MGGTTHDNLVQLETSKGNEYHWNRELSFPSFGTYSLIHLVRISELVLHHSRGRVFLPQKDLFPQSFFLLFLRFYYSTYSGSGRFIAFFLSSEIVCF